LRGREDRLVRDCPTEQQGIMDAYPRRSNGVPSLASDCLAT
jgi:hypothetical protein